MMNSTELQARIADAKGRASRLTEQQDLTVRDILSELYLFGLQSLSHRRRDSRYISGPGKT